MGFSPVRVFWEITFFAFKLFIFSSGFRANKIATPKIPCKFPYIREFTAETDCAQTGSSIIHSRKNADFASWWITVKIQMLGALCALFLWVMSPETNFQPILEEASVRDFVAEKMLSNSSASSCLFLNSSAAPFIQRVGKGVFYSFNPSRVRAKASWDKLR